MSNDDIIKALRLCAQKSDDYEECRSGQHDCPFGENVIDCTQRMNRAAADVIESLLEDISYLAGEMTTDGKCNICINNPNDMGCELEGFDDDGECHFEWRGLPGGEE